MTNLSRVDNMHSYESPQGGMAMEAESFTVLKSPKTLIGDSGLKEEEIQSEIDILPAECEQFFSTPVQSLREQVSSTVDLQENPSGYKSFFSLECNEIIKNLKSKSQSASKRKLEELDISTIEAEPSPLLCYTPMSALDKTTPSAKRRLIDYKGDTEPFSFFSCLAKHKYPGLEKSTVQCLVKVHKYLLNKKRRRHGNSTQKPRAHFNSAGLTKRSLFVKKSRPAQPPSSLPPEGETSVPKEWKTEPWIHSKGNFQNPESPTPALEFRSFFAAECENICNQLKRHDTERVMFSNVSSIEAEPPPVVSSTIHSTITLELGSACIEGSGGVSQLDLEKMNLKYSITERDDISQKASDTVLGNGNAHGQKEKMRVPNGTQDFVKTYKEASLANATQEIDHEASADSAKQEIQIIHNQYPIADVTQDISAMYVMGNEAKSMQGIVKMPPDASHANVPCIRQDTVKGPNRLPVVNATQDIITCDVSMAHGIQPIVKVGDWSAKNAIQDSLTCSKMTVLKDHPGAESNFSIANNIKNIGKICNAMTAEEAMQAIGTVCSKNAAVDATLDMIDEVCATTGAQKVIGKISDVDVTVDTGIPINHENRTTNIFHTCPQDPAQRNLVTDNLPLQNVTINKTIANVNCLQNIVSVHLEITPDSAIYKTFTHCNVTKPNVTSDILVTRETVRNCVKDEAKLVGYKDAPNFPPDPSVTDGKPKMNATHNIMSMCNEVTGIDNGDLTKVIATNCTVFDLSKNVYDQIDQPVKQSGHAWPISALAQSSPMKDLTYNLDLTDIAHDENTFYNRPIPLTTSTPLPSFGNHMFIKKPCGLPIKSKPSTISNQKDVNNRILKQRTVIPRVSRQSIAGEVRIRGGTSQDVQYPKIVTKTSPKASKMPRPSPHSTLALSAFKTPQMNKAVGLKKGPGALDGTCMKPPPAPTNLPRKAVQHGQSRKSGTSSSTQQTSVHSARADTDFF